MRVQVIFTGGTIGSRLGGDQRIHPDPAAQYQLLQSYFQRYGREKGIEFITEEPYYILSENLTAKELEQLFRCAGRAARRKDIDGIVITHGTDTLQYTGALLGYLLGGAALPILLVSADYPLEDGRSNGQDNFRYALEFISGGYGTGVFVSYCNKGMGQAPTIHRATRLQKHLAYSADVISVGDAWYGTFRDGIYQSNSAYRTAAGMAAFPVDPEKARLNALPKEILKMEPYVGMGYPAIPQETKAILMESYHSGTIGISRDLERFTDQAREMGIPIYLTGLSRQAMEYETVQEYRQLGICPLAESAPIAQYCKLWLAVSNGIPLGQLMKTSVAEDFICPGGRMDQ